MSGTWCWFALVGERPPGEVLAVAEVTEAGSPAGWFVAVDAEGERPEGALRVDRAVIDPGGPAMAVSFVLAPPERRLLFDDPAVVGAIRRAHTSSFGPGFVSTLTTDPVHLAGAVTGTTSPQSGWEDDDPFARLHPARRLDVGPGLFRPVPPPAGPGTQRYAGAPWPAIGF